VSPVHGTLTLRAFDDRAIDGVSAEWWHGHEGSFHSGFGSRCDLRSEAGKGVSPSSSGYATASMLSAPSSMAPATTAYAAVQACSYTGVHASPAISAIDAISTCPTTG